MNAALLQTLLGEPTAGQLAGGVMMILLFASVGILAASGTAFLTRRMLLGVYEKYFWSVMLVGIACFYMGFAAWFQVPAEAWQTEMIGIGVFVTVAALGAFATPALALGYLLHGLWDFAHSAFGTNLQGLPVSDIPLGYGMFCLAYDVTAAVYLAWCPKSWSEPGRMRLKFWEPV